MMIFRPQGIVTNVRRIYRYRKQGKDGEPAKA